MQKLMWQTQHILASPSAFARSMTARGMIITLSRHVISLHIIWDVKAASPLDGKAMGPPLSHSQAVLGVHVTDTWVPT